MDLQREGAVDACWPTLEVLDKVVLPCGEYDAMKDRIDPDWYLYFVTELWNKTSLYEACYTLVNPDGSQIPLSPKPISL